MIVGELYYDGSGLNNNHNRHSRVYERDDTSTLGWTLIGIIEGEDSSDFSVAISIS